MFGLAGKPLGSTVTYGIEILNDISRVLVFVFRGEKDH